jgi:hypothetical protein
VGGRNKGVPEERRRMTEAVMGFFVGVFVGLLICKLILHLEKLDWERTRVFYYGMLDGYKAGYEDGSNGRDFNPHRRRK